MKTINIPGTLLAIWATFVTASAPAAVDTLKVLFIGNSFIYSHDVPSHIKGLANNAGVYIQYSQHAPGGISVGDVSQGTSAHMNNPAVFNLIKSDNWDYVVLQDNQGRFALNYGIFPDLNVSKVIEGHIKIRDSVKHYHPCAKMIWFAGWAFKDGYPGLANTGQELIEHIYNNYRFMNDSLREIISPIGPAWIKSISKLPAVDLWGPDKAHQSLAGSYLTACVLFVSMFKTKIENVNYTAGLNTTDAKTMRMIAYETVKDSITSCDLVKNPITLTANGNTLTAQNGYTKYKWYRHGTLHTTTIQNNCTVTDSGCYRVVALDGNSCMAGSFEVCIQAIAGINDKSLNQDINIYPNPVTGILHIENDERKITNLVVSDISGKIIYSGTRNEKLIKIPLEHCNTGIYFIKMQQNNKTTFTRIAKY